MKKIIPISIFLLLSVFAVAQKRVMLQSNGIASVYTTITAAYNASIAGDTILVSGGKYAESISLSKPRVVVVGVGYNPDSCLATGITEIQGNVTLNAAADSCTIQGLYITGLVRIYDVDKATFKRNRIVGDVDLRYANFPNVLVLLENVMGNFTSYVGAVNNVVIEKNIIYGSVAYLDENCSLNNNVFLRKNGYKVFQYFNKALVENNVVYYTYDNDLIYGSTTNENYINNNLFISDYDYQANGFGNATLTNNITVAVADLNTVFVNYDGTSVYNLSNDFHLNPDSAAVWLGTDATPIGLYGTQDAALTSTPFKDGALPFNPHIFLKNVAKYTDENGLLQIEFKASSQEK